MSKCPFWSTNKERVNCYNECPMHTVNNENDICPFKELSTSGAKFSFAENLNDDLFYSQDRYSSYDEDSRVINY